MTRLKDPGLMRELHGLWESCACCGATPGHHAPSGIALELHHVIPRSAGGPDTAANLIGICPDCHAAIHRHSLNLKRNEAGILVWMSTLPGKHGWQPCVIPPDVLTMIESASPNGSSGWNVSQETPGDAADGTPRDVPTSPVQGPATTPVVPSTAGPDLLLASSPVDASAPTAADPDASAPTADPLSDTSPEAPPAANQDVAGGESPLPVVVDELVVTIPAGAVSGDAVTGDLVPAAGGGEDHEQRYTALRGLVRRSERDRLAAAILLWEAREQRDHELLGVSWQEYVSDAGLSKSAASKMLRAATTFRGAWLELSEADQSELNVERLYLGARLVSELGVAASEALSEAVSNPSHMLVARLRNDEPAQRCTCPHCGANHAAKQAGDPQ